jgi:DNA-binding response OmpR family regulator
MQTSPKLLLIEDNRSLARALCEALQNAYEIDCTYTGKSGLYRADITDYDVILLDLQLPDSNGLDICHQLRERGATIPIIIVSAETKVLSKINLLDAGANDYLTKPFSLGELKARIRAVVRAHGTAAKPRAESRLTVGELTLDSVKHEVKRGDITIELRKKEFLLLECLMLHADMVVTREALVRYAWNDSEKPWANTVDVHIKYLRDKIDRPFEYPAIKTVHGIGYKVVVPRVVVSETNTV